MIDLTDPYHWTTEELAAEEAAAELAAERRLDALEAENGDDGSERAW